MERKKDGWKEREREGCTPGPPWPPETGAECLQSSLAKSLNPTPVPVTPVPDHS